MFIEPETLAPIKNLENQVRLFIYDVASPHSSHLFVPMFNLLSYVTPIQYLFKEYLGEWDDDEREEEMRSLLLNHLWLVVRDFRILAECTGNVERTQDVWYSLFEAQMAIEEWTSSDCYLLVEEYEPFMQSYLE